MSDPLAGIKNAAAAAGIQIEREQARLVAEDRDRWKLQARIARAVAAAGWVLFIGALVSK